jgi:eukaryotic-like serine/threonine-protein kinase
MSPDPQDRWARIDELFGEALDRAPAERLDFLAAAAGDNRELFDAVRSLLASEEEAARLIGESVTDFAADLLFSLPPDPADVNEADDSLVGHRVGPYRVIDEIGRGGMGAVYLAERADGEFEKLVAIKLVKRGMDTDEILRRFRSERRILASLEHLNIARLYDGGASDDGRPYLVMELVEGQKITDYCDALGLSVTQRLDMFGSVCAAVQHAHQNLVVHRDIKPSNILVTPDGTPKLLDFGIARLVDDESGDAALTQTGMRMLTPDYAAPEQLRGEPVTTASDVFALGAVLYELLAGRRPFEARDRSASVRPLNHGDLDAVVSKALEEDPRLRYQSAQQLLDDVDRFRSGLPVMARPAALGYRAGKFARRHRYALAAAASVLLSLIGGLGAALWQADRAAGERDRAERERAIAEDERDAAEQVAAFLEGMFAAANPFSTTPGRMDTMRIGTFLERGAGRIGDEFVDRPLIRARMLSVLGRAYRGLGVLDRAEPLLTESLETYRTVHGNSHADVANAMNALGILYLDRERAADAEALHREALAIRRELLGTGHADVAQSLNNLAAALQNSGRLDEAEPLYDELLAYHRQLDPPDSANYADALNTRMVLAFRKDDIEAALPLAREILDINRALFGEEHPRVTQSMNNLGQLLTRTGADDEAEPLLRQSLEMNRTLLGGAHPNIAAGAGNLAGVLMRLGRLDDAEPLYLESIAMNRSLLGDQHPAVAVALSNYADLLLERGALSDTERLRREALAINRAALGPAHTNTGIVTARLAETLCRKGQSQAGRELYAEALAVLRASLSEQHSRVVSAQADSARCSP